MSNKTKKIVAIVLIALLLSLFFGLFISRMKKSSTKVQPTPINGVSSNTKKSSSANALNKDVSVTSGLNKGTASNIAVDEMPNSDNSTSSSNGNLVLYRPLENETLKSGSNISGTSQEASVYFRIIDDYVGVVAQGKLNVVNGRFNAVLNFSSKGKAGRIDVFNISEKGVETNEIQLPVRFNT